MSESFEPDTGEMIVKRVSVPIGLEELMEGLTKEVLLKKPDDIYLFAADYFSRLLMLRDKGAYKVKTRRNAQSIVKQTPKPPIEKLLVRGASKQLSRQLSIRGESPTKKVPPVKRPPIRTVREGRDIERNKFIDRRKLRKPEGGETKIAESKPKQVFVTPRPSLDGHEEKVNKRDRSLSNSRRGRSSSRSAQVTPRQKGASTPQRKTETPSDSEKSGKSRSGDKHKLARDDNKKEKLALSQISSIEETQEFVKDGKLTVTSPKIIKHSQVPDSQQMLSSLIVPQVVQQISSPTDRDSQINIVNGKEKLVQVGEKILNNQQEINQLGAKEPLISKDVVYENTVSKKEKDRNLVIEPENNRDTQSTFEQILEGIEDKKLNKGIKIDKNKMMYNAKSSYDENINKTISLDTSETEKSIESNSEEPTIGVISDSHETDKKDEQLSTDNKKTPQHDDSEDANLELKDESKLSAKTEELNTNLESEIIKLKDLSHSEAVLNSDIDNTLKLQSGDYSNQQNEGDIKKKEEDNIGESKIETTDKEKEVEQTKSTTSVHETIDNIKVEKLESANDTSSESKIQKDMNVVVESHQLNGNDSEKKKETSVATKSLDENTLEIDDRDNSKISSDKIPEQFDPKMEQHTEINDIKKGNTSGTTNINKKYSNQQNGSITDQKGNIELTNINEHISEISEKGKKPEDLVLSEVIDDIKSEKSLEQIPDIKSKKEKSAECKEKVEVTGNIIDEVDNTTISKLNNKGSTDIVALKEKNNENKLDANISKSDADNVELIEQLDSTETKDKYGETENQLSKDAEDFEKLKEVHKKLDLTEETTTENYKIKSQHKPEMSEKREKPEDHVISEVIDNSKSGKSLEQVPEADSTKAKSAEYKEKEKVIENIIDEVERTTISKLNNNDSTDIVALKEKNNENKVDANVSKSDADIVGVIEQLNVTKTKDKYGETENQHSKDAGDFENLNETDKKLDQSEEINTENDKIKNQHKLEISEKGKKPEDQDISEVIEDIKSGKTLEQVPEADSKKEKSAEYKEKEELRENIIDEGGNTAISKLQVNKTFTDAAALKNNENKLDCNISKSHEDNVEDTEQLNITEIKNTNGEIDHYFSKDAVDSEKLHGTEHKNLDLSEELKTESDKIQNKGLNLNNNENSNNIAQGTQIKDQDDLNSVTLKLGENQLELDKHSTEKDKENQTPSTVTIENKNEIHESSPLVESKYEDDKLNDNIVLDKNEKEVDKTKENYTTTTIPESGDELSTDSYSTSIDENITNKETTLSSTNTTEKDNTSKDEPSLQKVQSDPFLEDDSARNSNMEDSILEKDKLKDFTNGLESDVIHTSLKSNSPSVEKNDNIDSAISSVINIAKGGLMNQKVETYIDNFIQNEKQNVFVEKFDMAGDAETVVGKQINKSVLEKNQSEDKMPVKSVTNETLQDNRGDGLEHELQNNETKTKNIINSTINVTKDGSLDHQIKAYLSNFIQNENQHVFIDKHDKIPDSNVSLVSAGDRPTVLNEKEVVEDVPVQKSSENDAINSTSSVTHTGHVDDTDKKYIDDFLQNEKQNVHIFKQGTNKNDAKEIEKEIITTDDLSDIKEQIKKSVPVQSLDTEIKSENIIEEKSTTDTNMEIVESNNEHGKRINDFNKMRINTTDVIGDENKRKNQIKSRIPTADYRTRVKKDEMGKHSVRMKRSSSHNDVVRTAIDLIGDKQIPITKQDGVELSTNDPNKCVVSDENKHHQVEADTDKTMSAIQLTSKNLDGSPIEQVNKKFLDSKSTNITDDSSETMKSNIEIQSEATFKNAVRDDISLKEVVAALKIQALWRGFKVRKNMAHNSEQCIIEETTKKSNVIVDTTAKTDHFIEKQAEKREVTDSRNTVDEKQIIEPHSEQNKQDHVDSKFVATDSKIKSLIVDHNKPQAVSSDKENEYKLEKAATIIQKIWRGFKVRNKIKKKESTIKQRLTENATTPQKSIESKLSLQPQDQFIQAAILIQKLWRGFRVRKLGKRNIESEDSKRATKKEPVNQNEVNALSDTAHLRQAQIENKFVEKENIESKDSKRATKEEPVNQNEVNASSDTAHLRQAQIENKFVEKENIESKDSKKATKEEPVNQNEVHVENKFVEAAILIQKIWRGFKVRKLFKDNSKKGTVSKKTNELLIPINEKEFTQKVSKEELVKKETATVSTTSQKSTELKLEEEFIKAALVIQKVWRGFKIRNKSKVNCNLKNAEKPETNQLVCGKVSEAVTTCQNQVQASQETFHIKTQMEDEFVKAATLIQKIWRGFKVRKLFKNKFTLRFASEKVTQAKLSFNQDDSKMLKDDTVDKQIGADTATRQITKLESSLEDEFTKAAILIQKIWRGFKVRKLLNKNLDSKDVGEMIKEEIKSKQSEINDQVKSKPSQGKTEMNSQTEDEFARAVVLIQKVWRGFRVRAAIQKDSKRNTNDKGDNHLKIPVHETALTKSEEEFAKAALLIQKVWRGFKVRNELKRNSESDNKSDKTQQLKNITTDDAVTKQQTETVQKSSELKTKDDDDLNKSKYHKETEGNTDIVYTDRDRQTELDDKDRAAIIIQKIWRGFKVRKAGQGKELFGKPIKNEKSELETVKEIDTKDKKSALKIQSLWRGYQVRKNINVIKNKLEDAITSNDAGNGKEITDGDILNAATKIQAGVRGYLQRKKLKNDITKLNSISEESEKRPLTSSRPTVNEKYEKFNTDGRKLSEQEVLKALEDLNKLKVPTDIPILHKTDKPTFYRSDTVQELPFERKDKPLLLKSNSVDHITLKDTSIPKILNIDDNNNSDKKIFPLEVKVESNVDKIGQNKLSNEENDLNKEILKSKSEKNSDANEFDSQKCFEDSIKNIRSEHHNLNPIVIEDSENKTNLGEISQLYDATAKNKYNSVNTDTDNIPMMKNDGSSINVSKNIDEDTSYQTDRKELIKKPSNLSLAHNLEDRFDSHKDNKDKQIVDISGGVENLNQHDLVNTVNENKPLTQDAGSSINVSKNIDENTAYHINPEDKYAPDKEIVDISGHDQNHDTSRDKNVYERPVSLDSDDSVITVIYKEVPDKSDKGELEDDEINTNESDKSDSKSNEALSEHETLIGDLQNKLLDQLSGKTDLADETVDKFDIEQLRRELEEAGLIYNTDENNHIRHENSRELVDDHDQLLDYLAGFELSNVSENDNLHLKDSKVNLSSRDLPDIQEEDVENKATAVNDTLQMDKTNISEEPKEKINNKANESIISNDIKNQRDVSENDLNIEKIRSTLKECEDIAQEINMGFKALTPDRLDNQEAEYKSKHTENLPENKITTTTNQLEQLFCGTKEKQSEPKNIRSDVELITADSKIKSTPNGDKNKSSENYSNKKDVEKSGPLNGLLHTGELHDSVIAPFVKESDSQSEDLPKNMNVEKLTKDASEMQESQLLHTGELHDTVIPLSLRVQNNEETDGKQLNIPVSTSEIALSPSSSLRNPNIEVAHLKDDINNLSTKGLLHTGEFHDTLLPPLTMEFEQPLNQEQVGALEDASAESTHKFFVSEFPSKQPTKLLHTGELHDSIVLSSPKEDAAENVDDSVTPKTAAGEEKNNPRQVDSECQTSGEPAIEVQLRDVPAGVEALTSRRPVPVDPDVSDAARRSAQARAKGALPNASSSQSDLSPPTDLQSMESEKRSNATINNKSMEVEAATKIQAGFRGYQVRKQLKLKNGSSDIKNQRRQLRRKSSGRLTETNRIQQNKPKESSDIEEKSAVKIQAGVRGFLVRRRQKKQKNQES